jgi:hypothetical protein
VGDGMTEDDRLLAALRRLAGRVDPAPEEVTAFGRAALGWRRIDADLAELLSDSALQRGPALVRAEGAARSLAFRADDLELDVELRPEDGGTTILGQLAPAAAAVVEVQRDDGSTAATAEADALGRFRVELSGGGRVRLRVLREAPARPVETSWVDL